MDWHSWLSRTGLEPLLVHEYSLTFTRNELQGEDVAHFDHEFLQSMGISVAKHRLEILKLARKEVAASPPRTFSGLVKRLFTKKGSKLGFHKGVTSLPVSELSPYRSQWNGEPRKHMVPSRSSTIMRSGLLDTEGQEKYNISHGEVSPCRSQWNRESHKHMIASRSTMRSGPLEIRRQEKCVVPNRCLSLSGPLDGKVQEKMTMATWSPTITGPIDGRLKGRLVIANCGPSFSGPLDGVGMTPRLMKTSDNVKDEVQSLWSLMFQDLKPN